MEGFKNYLDEPHYCSEGNPRLQEPVELFEMRLFR